LNIQEQNIIKQTYELPSVLERICQNYKPHLLTNHLFELATALNSWYAKHSVSAEEDTIRKESMLAFCKKMREYMMYCLDLLGIETVEEL
jgi:arginyl-tRNA synthetase